MLSLARWRPESGNKAGLNIYHMELYWTPLFPVINLTSFDRIILLSTSLIPMRCLMEPCKFFKDREEVICWDSLIMQELNSRLAKKILVFLGAPVHTFNYSPRNIKQFVEKAQFRGNKRSGTLPGAPGLLGSIQIYHRSEENGKKSDEGRDRKL